MPKAYAYVRWSTAEQGGLDRDSHTRQTTPLEAFTATTGVEVVETIIDKGVRFCTKSTDANTAACKPA